ncbi:MAG TPA: M55 family metallopeptidase [Patescibacteria group bacterium]|nr:M55 family metallopeptidase [Patescibacteria group bacterium]
MRIYVSIDMEGLAGVAHPQQVAFGRGVDRVDYDRARALMAGEANAAIDAAFDAGAREVVVNDSHWQMRNLRAEDLDPRARLVIGDKPLSMTQGVGEGPDGAFDAAAFIGYHAGAGHPTGVIAHTYSSATVMDVRVGGVSHNEAALNAIRLGHHGVPVVLVSGDDALAGEVEALLPWAERVVVKRGLGYSLADSLSPPQAGEAIAEGMRRALGRLDEMALYELARPLDGEIDFRLPIQADYAAVLPGTSRVGGRTVRFSALDGDAFYRTFVALTRLAATPVVG